MQMHHRLGGQSNNASEALNHSQEYLHSTKLYKC
jgi:hypothetical protein